MCRRFDPGSAQWTQTPDNSGVYAFSDLRVFECGFLVRAMPVLCRMGFDQIGASMENVIPCKLFENGNWSVREYEVRLWDDIAGVGYGFIKGLGSGYNGLEHGLKLRYSLGNQQGEIDIRVVPINHPLGQSEDRNFVFVAADWPRK
jgi:hypothetical protein